MKSIPLFITLMYLVLSSTVMAQNTAPPIQWKQSFGGSNWDQPYCIQQTADKGYIVAGETYSDDGDVKGYKGKSTNSLDAWIVKLDSSGSIEWQRCLSESRMEEVYSIQITPDGGYILAGYTLSNGGDTIGKGLPGINPNCWIVKMDKLGNVQWQKSLGGSGADYAGWGNSIQTTEDGGYIVGCIATSPDGDVQGGHDGKYWIVKLDNSGDIQWKKLFGGTDGSGKLSQIYSIEKTFDKGYVVIGFTNSNDGDVSGNHGQRDYWVIKLDASGNMEWQKTYGGSNDEYGYSIKQTIDNGYVIAGYTASNDGDVTGLHGKQDGWIVKLDSHGNLLWQTTLGGNDTDYANAVLPTADGGYIVGGSTLSKDGDVQGNIGDMDYWLVKLDHSGKLIWQKCLGGTGTDELFSLQNTSDGGYILAGSTMSQDGMVSNFHGILDFWIVKMAADKGNEKISMSGLVYANESLLNEGTVLLYKKDAPGLPAQMCKLKNGSFLFNNIAKGNYLTYAIPDTTLHHSFFPSYFFNQIIASKAHTIPVLGSTFEVKIQLAEVPPMTPGNGIIHGNITQANGHSDSSNIYGFDWFQDVPDNAVQGNGVKNLPVILYDQQKKARDWTLTDKYGNYTFDSLPNGAYTLLPERWETGFDKEVDIIVSNESPIKIVDISLNTAPTLNNIGAEALRANVYSLYPNPSTNILMIEFKDENPGKGEIVVVNNIGQELLRQELTASKVSLLDIGNLSAGTYIIKIITSEVSSVSKFMKY